MTPPHGPRASFGLFPALIAGLAVAGPLPGLVSYVPTLPAADTTRIKNPPPSSGHSDATVGVIVPGYLSSLGLPPVPGQFTLSDTGLVFRSVGGAAIRATTVSLGYVDRNEGRSHYVFRIDAGVFETDAPGILLQLVADPNRLKGLKPVSRSSGRTLINGHDSLAALLTARQIAASPYADSLYALFGRPSAPIGVIGRRGRSAGRLGEYIAARDSLALDPARMLGEAQLRHALAHELGHRWQARDRARIANLWSGVASIRDPKRYGYGEPSEHQAEAIAFAINFLQTTAAGGDDPASTLTLLHHYELLVPGTRPLVRYLALQPLYRKHPLRRLLTGGRVTYALEN